MAISFRCPNGHKLTCPDQRAGQAGKCPKCGSVFHVPVPEQAQTEEALVAVAVSDEVAVGGSGVGSGDSSSPGVGSGSGPQFADGAPESPDPETIVFLCPNGHKLNAPMRLQGKPGKCPHCGDKFLVPLLDDVAQLSESGAFYDLLGEPSDPKTNKEEVEEKEVKPAATPHDSGFRFGGLAPEDEFTAGLIESSPQAMANLFSRLWSQRGEMGVVELYLKGGEILSPHWYAPLLSQHSFGMFAFQEQDGSHTLTAVHWDAIERIALRGLPLLPEGLFET